MKLCMSGEVYLSGHEEGYVSGKKYDEEEIIQYCRQNNRKAQKKLYEVHFGKMMATVRRYISDHDEAMEVVNAGFLKIFTNLHQYQGSGSFQGWMSKVMINTAIDYLRSNRNYLSNVSLFEEIHENEEPDISPGEFDDIDCETLYMMIDNLPPASRTVFNFFAIEGFSHQEISEKLGISIGTSKAHLHFARIKLKEMLDKYKRKN